MFRRASALKEMNEWEEAEADVKRARTLDPDDVAIKKLLAEIQKTSQVPPLCYHCQFPDITCASNAEC